MFNYCNSLCKTKPKLTYSEACTNINLRNKYILSFYPLIYSFAKNQYDKFYKAFKCSLSLSDLLQFSILTLINNFDKFDECKNISFSTFAINVLNRKVIDYFNNECHSLRVHRYDFKSLESDSNYNIKTNLKNFEDEILNEQISDDVNNLQTDIAMIRKFVKRKLELLNSPLKKIFYYKYFCPDYDENIFKVLLEIHDVSLRSYMRFEKNFLVSLRELLDF